MLVAWEEFEEDEGKEYTEEEWGEHEKLMAFRGQSQCHYCWGWGHLARECPHNPKQPKVVRKAKQPKEKGYLQYVDGVEGIIRHTYVLQKVERNGKLITVRTVEGKDTQKQSAYLR